MVGNGSVGIGTNNPTGVNALTNNNATLAVGIVTANTVNATNIKGTIVAPGSDTQILFNNGGNVGASANFTFNDSTNVLDVQGLTNLDHVNIAGITTISAGSFSAGINTGGRSIETNIDIRSTSLRSGIVVRNMNDFRSDAYQNAGFQVLDPYDSSSTSYAFRAAEGVTLVDNAWIKCNGTAYFSDSLGIGTTDPSGLMHLYGSSPKLFFTDSDTNVESQIDHDSSSGNFAINIDVNNSIGSNSNFLIRFNETDPVSAAKFLVKQTGEVGIGTNDPTGVNALTNNNATLAVGIITTNSGKITNNLIVSGSIGVKNTDPQYDLHVTGTAAATNFDSLSDRKVKTNIQVIQNPIDKIKKIDGVSFNWKMDNKPSLGVIADNVEEILPEIVSGNDPKSVNYNGLIGLLIEVVKDQQKQIDELRGLLDK